MGVDNFIQIRLFEPHHENIKKICLQGLNPGSIETSLSSHWDRERIELSDKCYTI